MKFRVNVTIEVDQVGNGLALQTPVPIQVEYDQHKWHARCAAPDVKMEPADSLEEAIIACGQQVAAEVQMAVIERPLIAGRITPDQIPADMFN
jgi:hypothetical protein